MTKVSKAFVREQMTAHAAIMASIRKDGKTVKGVGEVHFGAAALREQQKSLQEARASWKVGKLEEVGRRWNGLNYVVSDLRHNPRSGAPNSVVALYEKERSATMAAK